MSDEQCEAIMKTLIDFIYSKVLEIMAAEPYPEFNEALAQYFEESDK
jgi:hypothetical protein